MRLMTTLGAAAALFLVAPILTAYFAAAMAAEAITTAPVAYSTVDFSPVLNPIIQGVGIVAGLTALPTMWFVLNWIRSKMGLAAIEKDNGFRMAVDMGMQKSVGSAISQVQEAVAGLPMTIATKNKVIAQAATYAKETMSDTLKAAGLDDPIKLANAIEARLGIMEMQASTGSSAPGIASAAGAASGPSVATVAATVSPVPTSPRAA